MMEENTQGNAYTFDGLVINLNKNLETLGHRVQEFSKQLWGKEKVGSWGLFGEVRNKENKGYEYTYHFGGRKEFQFNVGLEGDLLRYGLAFSFEPGQDLPDPVEIIQPFAKAFNETVPDEWKIYELYCNGKKRVKKKVVPNIGDFWFYGEKIAWNEGNVTQADINRIIVVFEDLYEIYEKTMLGGKKVMESASHSFQKNIKGMEQTTESNNQSRELGDSEFIFKIEKLGAFDFSDSLNSLNIALKEVDSDLVGVGMLSPTILFVKMISRDRTTNLLNSMVVLLNFFEHGKYQNQLEEIYETHKQWIRGSSADSEMADQRNDGLIAMYQDTYGVLVRAREIARDTSGIEKIHTRHLIGAFFTYRKNEDELLGNSGPRYLLNQAGIPCDKLASSFYDYLKINAPETGADNLEQWRLVLSVEDDDQDNLLPDTNGSNIRKKEIKNLLSQLPPTDDKTNYFFFQSRPDIFDHSKELVKKQKTGCVEWHFSKNYKTMKPGGIAIFWMAGENRGVYGWGRILDNPEKRETKHHVLLSIEVVLDNYIKYELFKSHPSLKNLAIIKNPTGATFAVPTSHVKPLSELILGVTQLNFPGSEIMKESRFKASEERTITRDLWTTDDELDYQTYATSISRFIDHPDTKPPLTISIEAPWGGGKTSLMRMIQKSLDKYGYNLDTGIKNENEENNQNQKTISDLLLKDLLEEVSSEKVFKTDFGKEKYISVWFNAWHYQSAEQVWAGLADSIIRKVANRLENPLDKEKFFLRLTLSRLDRGKIRQDIHNYVINNVLQKSWKWLVAGIGFVFFGVLLTIIGGIQSLAELHSFGWIGGLIGGATTYAFGIKKWFNDASKEKANFKFKDYLTIPDYRAKQGFVHQTREDIRNVFDIINPNNRPEKDKKNLLIFIDDLDRCTPTNVAEVFESINLFLAGDFKNCVVIFGMDSEIVAASLQEAHKKILEHLSEDTKHISIGWRFMDKFVQLPFVIPPLDDYTLDKFMIALSSNETRQEGIKKESVADSPNDDESPSGQTAKQKDETKNKREKEEKQKEAVKSLLDRYEEDEEVKTQVRTARKYYSRNPREFKRFYNTFRFLVSIRVARLSDNKPVPSHDQLRRWIFLTLNWPELGRFFRRSYINWQGLSIDAQDGKKSPCSELLEKLEVAGAKEKLEEWVEILGADDKKCFKHHMDILQNEAIHSLFHEEGKLDKKERLSSAAGMGFW